MKVTIKLYFVEWRKKMKKMLFIVICLLMITGCGKQELTDNATEFKETFNIKHTFDDSRNIYFSFNIPYNNNYLHEAFGNNEITFDEFINKLKYVSGSNDGGSKLYKYNKDDQIFGNEGFYTIVCNSYMEIKDIFIAKNISSLINKCVTNTNELNTINNMIINYFTINGVKEYNNFCGNYVDVLTGVVVVELLDISQKEQDKFKKIVVDSDLIEFRKGEKGFNDLN